MRKFLWDLTLVNSSREPMPKKWIELWLLELAKQLKKEKVPLKLHELTLVFLDSRQAKKLNNQFRDKDYATDILSFEGDGEKLGELILCPSVLKRQATEHGHSFRAELGYMLIHGVLHLLGYEHEGSKAQARKMFALQDQVFDRMRSKFDI